MTDPNESRLYPSAMALAHAICGAARGVTEAELRAIEEARRRAPPGSVYAWKRVGDAPPLRPADRTYLTDSGVPPERLAPEEG